MIGQDIQYLYSIRKYKSFLYEVNMMRYIFYLMISELFCPLGQTCFIIINMGNCENPAIPKSQIIEPSVYEDISIESSNVRPSQIYLEEDETYARLPDFSEKLSLELNLGFVSMLSQSQKILHLPAYLITSYHALVYVPQPCFNYDQSFVLQKLYLYPYAGSRLTQYPIIQTFILAQLIEHKLQIIKSVKQSSMVNKSMILMISFQNQANRNRNVDLLESQKITQAGEICCINNKTVQHRVNGGQHRVKVEIGSIEYKFWRKYKYCSNIFAEQCEIVQNGLMQLQSSANSKYISLRPLSKALTIAPGPIFSKLSNSKYSFIGFYSGKTQEISGQTYFNIFTISSQISSLIYQISFRGFIVSLKKSNRPTIKTSIKNFLSQKSSQYCKFSPQFKSYQHYEVKDKNIICGKLNKIKDLQLHKSLISTNCIPNAGKFYLKVKLIKHCSDSIGVITIALKQDNLLKQFDDMQKFFEKRMYIRILKDNNTFSTDLGVNDRSFAFQQTKQTNFTAKQDDYLTFYLDMKQKQLTCIIKGYEEDRFIQSEPIRAFSFNFPEQLHGKKLQLYFETNKGGEQFRIC